jgi:predicted transcriptional regulator
LDDQRDHNNVQQGYHLVPETETETKTDSDNNPLDLATELTIAWLSNPNTRASADEVPNFLLKMHEAVCGLVSPREQEHAESAPEYTPAVSVRKSLASKDHIISLIDGKPYRTLRRHLAGHGLTPEQYRERYKLPADYPMVAQSYSEKRREMARNIGLGRKSTAEAKPVPAAAPAKSSRRRKAFEAPAE